ncbi:MAG: pentapeptide repeat-containing protein [Nitrospiraceae bacterium]
MAAPKPAPSKLRISPDPMYQLLRDGAIKEFNAKKASGQTCDLRSCDFRGLDLRGLDAAGLDFSDSYFRQADLRGIDFREAKLEGASINTAQVSGVLFPAQLSAQEIMLSLQFGTRMRYSA